ncbi:MAG: hypothetical protein MUF48_02955 [Pirellulaceae bacterium]|nr:hypothetical protein [Pirellulaceae bacterium]
MAHRQLAGWLTCIWPGLPRLWRRGDARGLAVAVGFSALLNLAVWASLLRTDAAPRAWSLTVWAVLGVLWTTGCWREVRQRSWSGVAERARCEEDLFIRAQAEYLKGHWVESHDLLARLIESNPLDIEAQLLLASVHRRTKRIDLSCKQLRQVRGLQESGPWRFEIGRELALLDARTAANG